MLKNFLRLPLKDQTLKIYTQNKAGFCIYAAYLDPKAHITMSHNPNNVYEDIVMIGDYLTPTRPMQKVTSQKYMDQILQITFDHLNSKYVILPSAKLDANNFEDMRLYGWRKYGIDFESEKSEILEKLSSQIFVTEHKLRWPLEQRIRLSYTHAIFSSFDLNKYRIEFFYELYNTWLGLHIDRSHLFRSPKVRGDASFVEKYLEDAGSQPTGVESLRRDLPENRTFINRMMNYIHS